MNDLLCCVFEGLESSHISAKYGFLYRSTKKRFYWFRLMSYVINFFVALQTVVNGTMFLTNFAFVGAVLPFQRVAHNLFYFSGGFYLDVFLMCF